MRTALAAFMLLVLLPSAQALPLDFSIDITTDGTSAAASPGVRVEPIENTTGTSYAWRLQLPNVTNIGEIRVHGAFNTTHVRAVVPEYNDSQQHPGAPHLHPHAFQVLQGADPLDMDFPPPEPNRKRIPVINITGNVSDFTYRVGLPGPGKAVLGLRLDHTTPRFGVQQPTDLGPHGFNVVTETDEPVLATLWRQTGDEAPVPLPTTQYDLRQIFPVQGMKADQDHRVWFTFTDWAGNEARSEDIFIATPPIPEAPEPFARNMRPEPNSTVGGPDVSIRATLDGNGSLIPHDLVRLFVDKREVHDNFTLSNGRLFTNIGPLEPGRHIITIELTNQAGGEGRTTWSFHVDDTVSTPLPVAAAFLALAGLALMRRRRT